MRLQRLELLHFRNMQRLELTLEAPRLLVIGRNGEGKSNLLESVELLGSLRSHRTASDRDLVQHDQASARVSALSGEGDQLELELRRVGGRQVRRNGKALERHSDLLASLRCVGFSALDLDLVRGEPSLRRHWLDRVVLQLEPVYSELLGRYQRLLRQRSQLLRKGLPLMQRDSLLDTFDLQMAVIGTRLHRRRRRALARLGPLAAAWHQQLSDGLEQLSVTYRSGSLLEGEEDESSWRQALLIQLQEQRRDELRLGQCGVGPHRDDVSLLVDDQPARRYGSAGQQRTLVLALKLAELELVRDVFGQPPLLLLDDVLAELDPVRQERLLAAVGEGHQCLVNATHLGAFTGSWRQHSQVVEMHRGSLQNRCSRN
ncbi:MAG: DNA replication/repair protein RecF [Cyanobacteriota bacterium]